MLNHFLAVGGNEIVNSQRAYGYATTGDCPVQWLTDPECETLSDAQLEADYDVANIADAPWFDPDDPETSADFLGLYGIDILGLSDSTREAVVVQRNGDGSVVTGYRYGPREVRVRGWLTAKGDEALELGMTWLRNALAPNACGMHGGSCGEADTEFFVDCPPPRRDVQRYTDWAPARRNESVNPSFEVNLTGWAGSAPGTFARVATGGAVGAAFARFTATSNIGFNVTSNGTAIPVTPGEIITVSAYVQGAVARQVRIAAVWTGATTEPGDFQPIPATWDRISQTFTVPAGATALQVRFQTTTAGAAGDLLDLDGVLVEKSATMGGYFDGDSVDSEFVRYSWAGTAGNSASIQETRSQYTEPEGDDTYLPYVASFRRYLHSVRCISGPFTVQEAESTNGVHRGRLVEFTLLANVPWVYGAPKEIDVPPMIPTVMQDIAYNLAPYPSAELPGAAVVVATNYATNPSAESNVTGWVSEANGLLSGAGTVTAAARSTLISSVGVASAMTEFTATAAGTAGKLRLYQEVPLAAPAFSRYSVNVWLTAAAAAGAPVFGASAVFASWRDAGNTTLRSDTIGTGTAAGGPFTAASLVPPAGATKVVVYAEITVASWVIGDKVRLFSDALAVTVP